MLKNHNINHFVIYVKANKKDRHFLTFILIEKKCFIHNLENIEIFTKVV